MRDHSFYVGFESHAWGGIQGDDVWFGKRDVFNTPFESFRLLLTNALNASSSVTDTCTSTRSAPLHTLHLYNALLSLAVPYCPVLSITIPYCPKGITSAASWGLWWEGSLKERRASCSLPTMHPTTHPTTMHHPTTHPTTHLTMHPTTHPLPLPLPHPAPRL